MLNAQLLQKANLIFLKSRKKVTDIFSGEFASAFRGTGMEFEEFREYSPGDDLRHMAWNVTARAGKPYVKVFKEEREQTVFFITDFSKSLDFGSIKSKKETLTETCALLAYATLYSNDKVGLITFADEVLRFIPPQKGKAHVWRLISELIAESPSSQNTHLSLALEYFLKVQKKRSIVFLISDFLCDINENLIKLLKSKHDVVCMRLFDPNESLLPKSVLLDYKDLESGQILSVDTRCLNLNPLYTGQTLKNQFQKWGIDFLEIPTSLNPADLLISFFIQREKKR